MTAFQNRSFARHAGAVPANGRRKHERFAPTVGMVAKSTNFCRPQGLFPAWRPAHRPFFVLSATERRATRSRVM